MQTTLQGFLLTRQWRDTPPGVELSYWVKTDKGIVHLIIPQQQAVCFIRQKQKLNLNAERKPLQLKTLQHEAVDGLYFKQQRDLNQLREHLSHNKKLLLESDIKPADRYLMERFVNASLKIQGHFTQKQEYLECYNPKIAPTETKPDLSWVSLDIETEDFRGKLYSIAVKTPDDARVFMVKEQTEATDNNIQIEWHPTEKAALTAFFTWLKRHDPDLILGWNIVAFDLDFLHRKCQQLRIPFAMGRGNEPATVLKPQKGGQIHIARLPGRAVLDGIVLLRTATLHFDSYELGYIAQQLLGKDKLITTDQNKLEEIRRQYREDPVALAQYNLEDCQLVADIFAQQNMIPFAIKRAEMTGLPIDRQGGSVAAFDHLYLPRLHRQGFVAPDVGSLDNPESSPGGYVMRSKPGLYKNVLVLDFKSLYPSIIRTFKIDPLGLAIGLKEPDNSIPGFLDAYFSRDQHLLPDIVTHLWQQRDLAKQQQDKALSQAIKIIMNSFYGVLGSSGCRFFNPQLASSITRRGHEIIQKSRGVIEDNGYPVIYGDTDSVFVLLDKDVSETQADQIGTQLSETLNQWWQQHLQDKYQLDSQLEIEYETHYLDFLLPTIRGMENIDMGSKKRYAGTIRTTNGDTKLIFKGMETVRSDWTELAKNFQQTLYAKIFNNEPYTDYIRTYVDKLGTGEMDEQLIYTKRLRRPLGAYTASSPPHVKAARKMQNPGKKIQYIITLHGPEPITNLISKPDYQHYLDKQLAPIADSILHFMDTSFEKVTARQLDVFG